LLTQRCANGELAGGEIGDLDVEVKWSCPCEEVCPGGDGCVLEIEVMTAEELLERYAAGERDFSGIRVSAEEYDTIFEGRDLSGINLCGSTLSGNWSGVNLSKARLRGITGDGWDLRQGNLSQANLSGTDFIQCDLTGCNFTEAILVGTVFRQAVIDEANFTGANLRGADLSEADLEGANFSGTNLQGVGGVNIDTFRHFSCTLFDTRMPDGSLCAG
jgi:uncharacterized protein YjbI with pentapeptide repeats